MDRIDFNLCLRRPAFCKKRGKNFWLARQFHLAIYGPYIPIGSIVEKKIVKRKSEGKFALQGDDLLTVIEGVARNSEKTFIEEKRLPMWTTAYVMAVVLGLLLAEWYFRRRWGLI